MVLGWAVRLVVFAVDRPDGGWTVRAPSLSGPRPVGAMERGFLKKNDHRSAGTQQKTIKLLCAAARTTSRTTAPQGPGAHAPPAGSAHPRTPRSSPAPGHARPAWRGRRRRGP